MLSTDVNILIISMRGSIRIGRTKTAPALKGLNYVVIMLVILLHTAESRLDLQTCMVIIEVEIIHGNIFKN